jgi:hypothetical protein
MIWIGRLHCRRWPHEYEHDNRDDGSDENRNRPLNVASRSRISRLTSHVYRRNGPRLDFVSSLRYLRPDLVFEVLLNRTFQ